jgi:hypothetical protein
MNDISSRVFYAVSIDPRQGVEADVRVLADQLQRCRGRHILPTAAQHLPALRIDRLLGVGSLALMVVAAAALTLAV